MTYYLSGLPAKLDDGLTFLDRLGGRWSCDGPSRKEKSLLLTIQKIAGRILQFIGLPFKKMADVFKSL